MSFQRILGVCALSVAALLSVAATAAPQVMQCVLDNGQSKGWIADQIFVEYDAATGAARVVDGLVLNFNKRLPATAKITENTDRKMVVTWSLNTRVGSQTAKMGYRAALLKPANRMLVTAKPHGYADNLTARGRCQNVQGSLPTG